MVQVAQAGLCQGCRDQRTTPARLAGSEPSSQGGT